MLDGLQTVQQRFMGELFEDTLGMAGAVMVRRIIGIAHIQDFKHISSDDLRLASALVLDWLHNKPL